LNIRAPLFWTRARAHPQAGAVNAQPSLPLDRRPKIVHQQAVAKGIRGRVSAMPRIMIIRHAEKHTYGGGVDRSVGANGVHTKHELTVRGWLRAGALAPFFAPVGGLPEGAPVSTPKTIFASAATRKSPSLRPQHTVQPLADLLRIRIDTSFACGREPALAARALEAPGPVLIVWHHSHICDLARMIAPGAPIPREWPDERFDVVWVLDRHDDPAAAWTFSQAPQRLFAYDSPHPI
jgi:hypothetical protein